MTKVRFYHTANILLSGKILFAGGAGDTTSSTSSELLDIKTEFLDARRPVINGISSMLERGDAIQLTGTGFTGDTESASGTTNSSASNSPLLQIRRIDNNVTTWVSPSATSTRSATNYESAPLLNLPAGPYAVTLFVNAIPSASRILRVNAVSDVIFADGFD